MSDHADAKKPRRPREALQIYRPPGRRSGGTTTGKQQYTVDAASVLESSTLVNKSPTPPTTTTKHSNYNRCTTTTGSVAGQKQPNNNNNKTTTPPQQQQQQQQLKNGKPQQQQTNAKSVSPPVSMAKQLPTKATKHTALGTPMAMRRHPPRQQQQQQLQQQQQQPQQHQQQQQQQRQPAPLFETSKSPDENKRPETQQHQQLVNGHSNNTANGPTAPPPVHVEMRNPPGSGGGGLQRNTALRKSLTLMAPVPQPARKEFSDKDMAEIRALLTRTKLIEQDHVRQFVESSFHSEPHASTTARALVAHATSGTSSTNDCKALARCTANMLEGGSTFFHAALVSALNKQYEHRDKLRKEQFRQWLAFINFVSDLYSTLGFTHEGELVDVIFRLFEYMLRPPVLDTLRIEELECLISCLLAVGYDLERQSPSQVAQLRDSMRDALVDAHEPWSRKLFQDHY